MKSKSVAISTSYLNLSTLSFAPNAAGAAGYSLTIGGLFRSVLQLWINDQQGVHASTTSTQHMRVYHGADILVPDPGKGSWYIFSRLDTLMVGQ